MSDTYHYEEGAIHNDHKKVLQIGNVGVSDVGKLLGAFFHSGVEEAEIVEESSESGVATEELNVEELNYEAPKINLQQLLKQPWFSDARSDEMYTAEWTDAFVDALMGSEYGEALAREWNNGGRLDRCTQIKGYLLGLLKDAGALKGSYDAIAEKANLMDNPRSFSRYMANGKKQPYAQWVKGCVKGEEI